MHGFKTCKGCRSLQNRTKGAETPNSKFAKHRLKITLKRNFQKLRESPGVRYESVGRGFESLPSHQEKPEHVCVLVFLFVSTMEGARTGRRRIASQAISPVGCCLARGFQHVGMSTVEAVNRKISWLFLFCKPWVHGSCTAFARSVFSMYDYVGRCIALQSVPFFASGEQGQAELCLHFRVGILEQFQETRHGDGRFACGRYSLRAGGVRLGIEAAFKLLAQLHTGGLLDVA